MNADRYAADYRIDRREVESGVTLTLRWRQVAATVARISVVPRSTKCPRGAIQRSVPK
jgi:hypothetical protein